jgi:hypothetical protein
MKRHTRFVPSAAVAPACEMGLIDPRVLATASGAVFAGLSRITQMVSRDGTSTYAYDAKSPGHFRHAYVPGERSVLIRPQRQPDDVGLRDGQRQPADQ